MKSIALHCIACMHLFCQSVFTWKIMYHDLRRRSERRRTHPDQEPKTMKKYTKLLLAIVAVISSLFFIIYKYRYDRLYHVMQVKKWYHSPSMLDLIETHSTSSWIHCIVFRISCSLSKIYFSKVLEVFGSPDQSGGSSLHSYVSSITVPSWQNMGQGVWIYAAYCSSACSQVCFFYFTKFCFSIMYIRWRHSLDSLCCNVRKSICI